MKSVIFQKINKVSLKFLFNKIRELNSLKNSASLVKQTMGKVIAAINMTLDGFCDHTAITADEELHNHYTELL
ncbi:MAG: hypothetical protein ABI091_30735 [Ferruginibacter sp.]